MSKIRWWLLLVMLYSLYFGLWSWMAVDLWKPIFWRGFWGDFPIIPKIVGSLFCALLFIGFCGLNVQARVWVGKGKKQGEEGYDEETDNLRLFWIYTSAWLGWFLSPESTNDGMVQVASGFIGIIFFAPLAIIFLSRARLFRP
ncbi:MAG: hypothetical protein Q7N87_05190 [Candidatus Uhrbacteria bacterium]|nr:hypothetical protein [Candidatus Uhrbacteria bacterium]